MRKSRVFRTIVSHILRRIPSILGCLLFLISFISPFYHYDLPNIATTHYSVEYWSFKSEVRTFGIDHFGGFRQYWFSDCWFDSIYQRSFGLGWVLISMLIAQILTLAFGAVSVIINRRGAALLTLTLCLTTTSLMIYFHKELWEQSSSLSFFEQGYWLTYPSALLFIAALILSMVINKKKTTDLKDTVRSDRARDID